MRFFYFTIILPQASILSVGFKVMESYIWQEPLHNILPLNINHIFFLTAYHSLPFYKEGLGHLPLWSAKAHSHDNSG